MTGLDEAMNMISPDCSIISLHPVKDGWYCLIDWNIGGGKGLRRSVSAVAETRDTAWALAIRNAHIYKAKMLVGEDAE
jgi:hypothetical protein